MASAADPQEAVFNRLGLLARQLHDSLRGLGVDKLLEDSARQIPDARQRLAYIAQMTEQAASRVLNATDIAKPVQDELIARSQALSQRWETMFANQLSVDEFKALPFQEQVDLVAQDLQAHFWQADARVVANSFGAYLFLHAQAQLPPFPGRVLLLSPIVGEFSNDDTQMNFIPPRVERLQALVQAGQYPTPARCEVHVGEDDWQSNPVHVAAFGKQLGLAVTIVPQAGHMLGKSYVSALLDRWL